MSLFDHLVERALELARPVEPVIDPSPLGPPVLGPGEGPGFTETTVELPASRSPASSDAVVRTRVTTAGPSPVVERRSPMSSPSLGAEPPPTTIVAPRLEQAPTSSPSTIAPRSTVIVEREPASVIVERRVDQRLERTRELVRESRVTIEPATIEVPTVERPAPRRAEAAPIEPRRGSADRSPGEPEVKVIERISTIAEPVRPAAPPSREPAAIASPVVPARRELANPRPAAAPAIPRREQAVDPGPTYKIEIGRVIVRAESPAPQKRAPAASARPLTSLTDYLARRDRGER